MSPDLVRSSSESRREFVKTGIAGVAGLVLAGCGREPSGPGPSGGNARLQVRPRTPTQPVAPGQYEFQVETFARGILHVPAGAGNRALPLVLLFHGAGGFPIQAIRLLEAQADEEGLALVAVKANYITWDAIGGEFGPDLDTIDLALDYTFDRVRVDASRMFVAGFSDGATYALAVGRGNGDMFRGVLAFSPGYLIPTDLVGKPRVFVSHGRQDEVLGIDETSRVIVPELRSGGYQVQYEEFDGNHEVPQEIRQHAVNWMRG